MIKIQQDVERALKGNWLANEYTLKDYRVTIGWALKNCWNKNKREMKVHWKINERKMEGCWKSSMNWMRWRICRDIARWVSVEQKEMKEIISFIIRNNVHIIWVHIQRQMDCQHYLLVSIYFNSMKKWVIGHNGQICWKKKEIWIMQIPSQQWKWYSRNASRELIITVFAYDVKGLIME